MADKNIHDELLPEGYRFSEEDEKRLDAEDFYTHRTGQLPVFEQSESDRFMAWRWYGNFMKPMDERLLGAMAWRISRERQLLSARDQIETIQANAAINFAASENRWHEAEAEVDLLKAAIATPEVYAGIISEIVEKDFAIRLREAEAKAEKAEEELAREERTADQLLTERDQYYEVAEKLSEAIAAHFGEDIGEHSNCNDPFSNALEIIKSREAKQ